MSREVDESQGVDEDPAATAEEWRKQVQRQPVPGLGRDEAALPAGAEALRGVAAVAAFRPNRRVKDEHTLAAENSRC